MSFPVEKSTDEDSQSPLVVVGIPAFNAEKTIARMVLGAQKNADVVIVCDDGSTDMTSEIAERLGAVVIRHSKNFGYGAALQSLFKRARELKADILVTLDSDCQHDPAAIPQLVKPIQERFADVVLGSRFMDKEGLADMPLYRQFGVRVITNLANRSSKKSISDAQSGFRAYSRRALESLGYFSENGMNASVEILRAVQRSGLRVIEVPITCKYLDGVGVKTSTKNPISQGVGIFMYLVKLVVEDKPLTFLGLPGIISLIAGIFFGVWMVNNYVASHEITTNIALASIAFILIGFFLVSMAVTLYAITRLSAKLNGK